MSLKYDGDIATRGWIDRGDFKDASNEAWNQFDRWLDGEAQITYMLADAAYDAGFEAGVEAQKHGLGEIPLP